MGILLDDLGDAPRSTQPQRSSSSIASTPYQQTQTPIPPSKTMKLTVAALALLVVGASYVDMAAAKNCWHGKSAQTKCDKYVAKHWGSKCEAMGFGKSEVCAVPGATPPTPSPPTPPPPTPPHKHCWHGKSAQTKCDKYVSKHWGTKCEAMGFGKAE